MRAVTLSLTGALSGVAQLRMKIKQANEVGLFNHWLERNNFQPIAQWVWVDVDGKRKKQLQPVLDASGQPRRCTPAALVEWLMKMAHGDAVSVPKGGFPEYRNGEQYRDTFGKRQGDMLAAHEQEFGYGPYATQPYRYVSLEKKLYAVRAFYKEVHAASRRRG